MTIHHTTPEKRTHENGRGHGGPGAGPTRREKARRPRGADGGPPEKDSGPHGDATALPDRARLRPERYNQHYRTPIMATIIEKRGPLRYAQGRGSGKNALTTEPRSHTQRRRAVAITKGRGSASRSRPNRRHIRERSERIEPTSTQRAPNEHPTSTQRAFASERSERAPERAGVQLAVRACRKEGRWKSGARKRRSGVSPPKSQRRGSHTRPERKGCCGKSEPQASP